MRLGLTILGYALTGVVLWLAGWNDRVVDEGGAKHYGRVVEVRDESATLVVDGTPRTLRIRGPGDARIGLRSTFASLLERPGPALLGILLQLGATVVCILRWNVFLNGADLRTPAATTLRLGFVGAFFNNVLPAGAVGGDLVKAWYATRTHPERKPMAVVSVLADRGIGMFVIASVAAIAILFAPEGSRLETAKAVSFVFFALCVAFLGVLFWPGAQRALRIRSFADRLPGSATLLRLGQAFNVYGSRPGVVAKATLLGIAVHAQALAAFWFYGLSLGIRMEPMAVFVAIPVALMAASVPGMPGGWGVGNLAFFVALPAAGVPVGIAVALSVTYNLVQLLLSLPGGLFLGRFGPAAPSDRREEA
jgi:hypothetical protein